MIQKKLEVSITLIIIKIKNNSQLLFLPLALMALIKISNVLKSNIFDLDQLIVLVVLNNYVFFLKLKYMHTYFNNLK